MSEKETSSSDFPPAQLSPSNSSDREVASGRERLDASSPKTTEIAISAQVVTALNEWVAGLAGPNNPPFYLDAQFPDSEWGHFFRIFAVSTALAAVVSKARDFAPDLLGPVTDSRSLGVVAIFASFGVIYSLYSKLFGISITIRQSLFCFALITPPWLPLYAIIKTNGHNLGIVWFVLMPGLGFYVFFLLARAIHIVSGAGKVRVVFSLLLPVVLTAAAYRGPKV